MAGPRRIALVLGGLILILVVVSLTRTDNSVPPVTTPPVTAGLSDAAIKAAMVENLNAFPDSTSDIPRAGGVPDIAVSSGVVIVATNAPATADTLCRLVAGLTNDPDTGKPLGVSGVAVISGGESIATCR